jgi:hypothetical protein
MQLVNLTTRKILIFFLLSILLQINVNAQLNSPYSRYGIGDLMNHSNVLNRGMGGISIGFSSDRFINSDNPASYSSLGFHEKDITKGNGNLINFEVGSEFVSQTLNQKNPIAKYNSKNLLFNYMQLGLQVGKKGNWGFNLALQPIANENYKILNNKRISGVDSISTVYDGTGGSYKALIGTGYKLKNFSFGINTGYIFGKKNTSTNLLLINDTTDYYESSSNTRTSYGNVFLHTGILYDYKLTKTKMLRFGLTYELQNNVKANQDIERLVYDTDNSGNPNAALDSIFVQKDVKGTIILPSTFAVGITYQESNSLVLGADFSTTAWNNYRFYGSPDQVKNSWVFKTGVQFTPTRKSKSYWNSVTYRTGFNYGTDYITASGKTMPVYTASFGLGLPIKNNPRTDNSLVQPVVNLALEVGKRGNNTINLRENFVKISLGVSLTDIWFFRRKFD